MEIYIEWKGKNYPVKQLDDPKYMTIDKNGDVYIHTSSPEPMPCFNMWCNAGPCERLCHGPAPAQFEKELYILEEVE